MLDFKIGSLLASWSWEQITLALFMVIIGTLILSFVFFFVVGFITKNAGTFFVLSILFSYMTAGELFDDPTQYGAHLLYKMLGALIVILIYTGTILFIRRRGGAEKFLSVSSSEASSSEEKSTTTNLYTPRKPAYTFKDVCGMDELKAQLMGVKRDHVAAGCKLIQCAD